MKLGWKSKTLLSFLAGAGAISYLGLNMISEKEKNRLKIEEKFMISQQQIIATVLEEKWTNNNYIMVAKEESGRVIAVSVIDDGGGRRDALDTLVSPGLRIVFPAGNMFYSRDGHYSYDDEQTYLHLDNNICTKRPGWISVFPPKSENYLPILPLLK